MLTITLQGEEALEYLTFLNSRSTLAISKETPPVAPKQPASVDTVWRHKIDMKIIPESRKGSMWTEQERKILRNAANQTDKRYYGILTLATYMGRSRGSIASEAIRQGYDTSNGLLSNSYTKDKH